MRYKIKNAKAYEKEKTSHFIQRTVLVTDELLRKEIYLYSLPWIEQFGASFWVRLHCFQETDFNPSDSFKDSADPEAAESPETNTEIILNNAKRFNN